MIDEQPEEPVEAQVDAARLDQGVVVRVGDESSSAQLGSEVSVGERRGGKPAKVLAISGRLSRPTLWTWVVLLGYVGLGFAYAHRLWPAAGHRILGSNTPDAALFAYFFNAVPHAVAHGHPFVLEGLNAPLGVPAMWNTTLMLPALVLWPVTALGGGLLTVNVLLTLGPALSAFSAFVCLRRYLPSVPARFVAGLVFGFSPAVTHQALGAHLHEVVLWLVPPILLQVVRLCTGDGPPQRVGLWLGLLVAAQLLTGEEALAQTALTAALVVIVLAACAPHGVPRALVGVLTGGATAVGVAVLVTAWPLYEQFFGPLRQHGTPFVPDYYRNDLLSFTTATPQLFQHSHTDLQMITHLHGGLEEQGGFLGPRLLLLIALTFLLLIKDIRIRVATLTGIGLGVLSLGTTLLHSGQDTRRWLPWSLFHNLPAAESLLPNRLSLLIALCVGVVVGITVEQLLQLRPWIAMLDLGAVALCLLPLVPRPLTAVGAPHVPAFFRDGTATRVLPHDAAVLVLPFPSQYPTEPQAWQAAAGLSFRMPGGYFLAPSESGQAALGSQYRATSNMLLDTWVNDQLPTVTEVVRRNFANDLAYWGAHTVLLGPTYRSHETLLALATAVLGPPTAVYGTGQDEVEVWLAAKVIGVPPG